MMIQKSTTLAVIGLGYVGLPLAVHFGEKFKTIGFDLKPSIIENCHRKNDPTGEVDSERFDKAIHFIPTTDPTLIGQADFIVVAVPTPIDPARRPDLTPLESASKTVGKHMKKGTTVIYESTVFPGATEEVCIPILEKESGFTWKEDFHVGYSPERINPGDKEHTLTQIVKVVSGDTPETLDKVAALYESIVTAGVHRTVTIKEAEAAKVIENTQRDLNIALMNELSLIFDRLGIDTKNVLEAAGSKWNFLKFTPGLVGGHCIGVDPYYLTYRAQMAGYHPEMILAGRRINDSMGHVIVKKCIQMLIHSDRAVRQAKVGVLGLTFKENCPDLRNTRVIDIIDELRDYGVDLCVHDPMADPDEAKIYYGVSLSSWEEMFGVDALIVAVPHAFYQKMGTKKIIELMNDGGVLIDVKSMLDSDVARNERIAYWRL